MKYPNDDDRFKDFMIEEWRRRDPMTEAEALVALRETWKRLCKSLTPHARDMARVVPIRSTGVPWWAYRPDRDVVEAVEPEAGTN